MPSDKKFNPAKPTSPVALGAYAYNKLAVPPTNATPGVGDGIGLNVTKPPKSFIIFDQTENKCRIMFYPGCSNKFDYPNKRTTNTLGNYSKEDAGKESSSFKEDTKDIDALLSLEDEEEDGDEDDEEVSTGRTMGNISGGSSPDSSYSTDGSASCKTRLSSLHNYSSISGSSSERKRKKMKKLIKALREIVPGGDRLDAAAVLDESVTYLKSLKMEVMKLGMKNFKSN